MGRTQGCTRFRGCRDGTSPSPTQRLGGTARLPGGRSVLPIARPLAQSRSCLFRARLVGCPKLQKRMQAAKLDRPPQYQARLGTRRGPRSLRPVPLNDLLFRAQSVHRRHHPANEVQISTLLSIKTGGCPEDCKYCPQSVHYDTGTRRPQPPGGGRRRGCSPRKARECRRDAVLHGRRLAEPDELPRPDGSASWSKP